MLEGLPLNAPREVIPQSARLATKSAVACKRTQKLRKFTRPRLLRLIAGEQKKMSQLVVILVGNFSFVFLVGCC